MPFYRISAVLRRAIAVSLAFALPLSAQSVPSASLSRVPHPSALSARLDSEAVNPGLRWVHLTLSSGPEFWQVTRPSPIASVLGLGFAVPLVAGAQTLTTKNPVDGLVWSMGILFVVAIWGAIRIARYMTRSASHGSAWTPRSRQEEFVHAPKGTNAAVAQYVEAVLEQTALKAAPFTVAGILNDEQFKDEPVIQELRSQKELAAGFDHVLNVTYSNRAQGTRENPYVVWGRVLYDVWPQDDQQNLIVDDTPRGQLFGYLLNMLAKVNTRHYAFPPANTAENWYAVLNTIGDPAVRAAAARTAFTVTRETVVRGAQFLNSEHLAAMIALLRRSPGIADTGYAGTTPQPPSLPSGKRRLPPGVSGLLAGLALVVAGAAAYAGLHDGALRHGHDALAFLPFIAVPRQLLDGLRQRVRFELQRVGLFPMDVPESPEPVKPVPETTTPTPHLDRRSLPRRFQDPALFPDLFDRYRSEFTLPKEKDKVVHGEADPYIRHTPILERIDIAATAFNRWWNQWMARVQKAYPKRNPSGYFGLFLAATSYFVASHAVSVGLLDSHYLMHWAMAQFFFGLRQFMGAWVYRFYLASVHIGAYPPLDAAQRALPPAERVRRAFERYFGPDRLTGVTVRIVQDIVETTATQFGSDILPTLSAGPLERSRILNLFRQGYYAHTDPATQTVVVYVDNALDGPSVLGNVFVNNTLYDVVNRELFVVEAVARNGDFDLGLALAHEVGKMDYHRMGWAPNIFTAVWMELMGNLYELAFLLRIPLHRQPPIIAPSLQRAIAWCLDLPWHALRLMSTVFLADDAPIVLLNLGYAARRFIRPVAIRTRPRLIVPVFPTIPTFPRIEPVRLTPLAPRYPIDDVLRTLPSLPTLTLTMAEVPLTVNARRERRHQWVKVAGVTLLTLIAVALLGIAAYAGWALIELWIKAHPLTIGLYGSAIVSGAGTLIAGMTVHGNHWQEAIRAFADSQVQVKELHDAIIAKVKEFQTAPITQHTAIRDELALLEKSFNEVYPRSLLLAETPALSNHPEAIIWRTMTGEIYLSSVQKALAGLPPAVAERAFAAIAGVRRSRILQVPA